MRTIEQLLIEAWDVQDACNLSGVVHSFARALTDLRENGVNDTDALNMHPVSVLYADKIRHLSTTDDEALTDAFNLAIKAKKSAA